MSRRTNAPRLAVGELSRTLTGWQSRALRGEPFNLADGHSRVVPDTEELAALQNAALLASTPYHLLDQNQIELEFLETFLAAAAESRPGRSEYHVVYSASMAISLIATALKQSGSNRIGITYPSFDNIPQLLARAGLECVAIKEAECTADAWGAELDAVFLTMPGNPTGFLPSQGDFQKIASACAARSIPLILDLTFRFQSPGNYSIYEELTKFSALDYIAIEDTGKTWGLNDLKLAFILSKSGALNGALAQALDEMLLNVSPVLLMLLSQVIRVSARCPNSSPLTRRRELAAANRVTLSTTLPDALKMHSIGSATGFLAWIKLPTSWDCNALAKHSETFGVSLLPGDQFFWADDHPPAYIRIALLRDPDYFREGCRRLSEAIKSFSLIERC